MKQILIAICAGLMALGIYSHLGLGVDASGSLKTVLVFALIIGVSSLMGIFGMVPFVKSAKQRAEERKPKNDQSEN